MKQGKVKFFNESKGYGFIKDDEGTQEYFVHISGLVDEVRENDSVTFELKEGKKNRKLSHYIVERKSVFDF